MRAPRHRTSERRGLPVFGHALVGFALFGLALLTFAPVLHADAVLPPPSDCPDGSSPSTCHGGPHCEPISCGTDADCAAGRCVELQLCTQTVNCAGNIAPGEDPAAYDRPSVLGPCSAGSCSAGSCSALRVCASPSDSNGTGGSTVIDEGTNTKGVSEGSSGGCTLNANRAAANSAATSRGLVALVWCALGVIAGRRRRARATLSSLASGVRPATHRP